MTSASSPHRLVVLRAGALGDLLLTLPALHALRARYPEHRIHAVGYPALWRVAGDLIDDVASIDSALFAGLLGGVPSPELHTWLQGVDVFVGWSSRPLSFTLSPSTQVVTVSPYPPPGVHAAVWLLQSVLGPDREPPPLPDPLLHLSADERAAGQELLSGLGLDRPIIIHPGAGAGWKRWPADRFARAADVLRARGHSVALVEGPADVAAVAEVQSELPSPLPVIRESSLRTLAAALAASEVVIANDSGVTHLAAAAGARTVALFGPTDPMQWAPLGKVRVLRGCEARATRQGQIRVSEDPTCLEGISVEAVVNAL